MQRKPGRLARALAALLLVGGVSACAQILGDDFEIADGPGGGSCDQNDCNDCISCAIDNECAPQHEQCNESVCNEFSCCLTCSDYCEAGFDCDCNEQFTRLGNLDFCLNKVCPGCVGGSVTGGGA